MVTPLIWFSDVQVNSPVEGYMGSSELVSYKFALYLGVCVATKGRAMQVCPYERQVAV